MYDNGQGVSQDYKQAVTWYSKAAEQGVADAQLSLMAAYCDGRGVQQDYQQAYAWSSVAAANGNSKAAELRDLLAKELTPAALVEARALASSYFKQYQAK